MMNKSAIWIIAGIIQIILGLIIRPIGAFNAFIPIWIGTISLGIGFIGIGFAKTGCSKVTYAVPMMISMVGCIYMLYRMILFYASAFF